ncbi:MAG TPA: gamma-glutamylcyclotransferase family protein [Candidatus Tectomicrobia bacterium]|jgi:gamma-glutamylcyclotransferase (GGCT)/AIG2-like uncharacterized protein YtfP|nr:gamma-glutamylcyclotransferase family protein [Candidatus Tectomicrobia bacterium]
MPGQEPIHLFVYGTLTDPERVTALTGKRFSAVDATLTGFERVESPLGYPYIFPRPGAVVRGVLLCDIDPASLVHLDAYEAEGELYRRQVVEVEVVGTRLPAMTYVGHGIRASALYPPAQCSGPNPRECCPEAEASTRCLRAPVVDEH